MRRALLIIAALACLGALANLAVTWLLATVTSIQVSPDSPFLIHSGSGYSDPNSRDSCFVFDRFGCTAVLCSSPIATALARGHLPRPRSAIDPNLIPHWAPPLPSPSSAPYRVERKLYCAYGWPLRCLYHVNTSHLRPPAIVEGAFKLPPLLQPLAAGSPLPYFALPVPLILNSLLYAAVICALGCALRATCRLLRRARHCCPQCGYPTLDSAICS